MLIIHHHTPLHILTALLNNTKKTNAYHFLEMGAICNISFVTYDL